MVQGNIKCAQKNERARQYGGGAASACEGISMCRALFGGISGILLIKCLDRGEGALASPLILAYWRGVDMRDGISAPALATNGWRLKPSSYGSVKYRYQPSRQWRHC